MKVSEKIIAFRKANKITQEEFAEAGDLTRSAVAAIESGRNENPQMETLIGIAKAMGVSLDELVEG